MDSPFMRQVSALLRRRLLHLVSSIIVGSLRVFIVPTLLLCLLLFVNHKDEKQAKITVRLIPTLIKVMTVFNLYFQTERSINDKMTGVKSLMMSMGLKPSAYFVADTIWFSSCILPPIMMASVIFLRFLADSQATKLEIVATFFLVALQLTALMLSASALMPSSGYAVFIFVLVTLDMILHYLLQTVCKSLAEDNPSLLQTLVVALSVSPYESLEFFSDSYLFNLNAGYEVADRMIALPTWRILLTQVLWTIAGFVFAAWMSLIDLKYCLGQERARAQISDMEPNIQDTSKYFELTDTRYREVGIQLDGLSKSFERVVAIDRVSFNIFKGESTLLLGHNGAGKSTLMNLITGILEPDMGSVAIKGQTRASRLGVGLCPQTSILDDEMTVRQHLELFTRIKCSLSPLEWELDVDRTLHDIGLASHANKRPPELSGGLKRKLSLGLAFVGRSDVLILDEPSSGLDPDSRCFIWDAIRRYRTQRTVLLSTQHMEEADYLGDRIAIMSAGRIVCCGSSVFLNRLFGTGYKMRLECESGRARELFDHIRANHFDALRLSESTSTEPSGDETDLMLSLELSNKSADSEETLIRLLEELERDGAALGLISFGLSSSSIEDVMLETGKHFNQQRDRIPTPMTNHIEHLTKMNQRSLKALSYPLVLALVKKQLLTYVAFKWSVLFFRIILPLYPILHSAALLQTLPPGKLSEDHDPTLLNAMLITHLVYSPTMERASKFKIMQLTSHANFKLYWLSQMVVDLMSVFYMVSLASAAWVFYCSESSIHIISRLDLQLLVGSSLFLFGLASMLLAYLVSLIVTDWRRSMVYWFLLNSAGFFVHLCLLIIQSVILKDKWDLLYYPSLLLVVLLPCESLQSINIGLVAHCYVHDNYHQRCLPTDRISPLMLGFVGLSFQIILFGGLLFWLEQKNISIWQYFQFNYWFSRSQINQPNSGYESPLAIDQDVLEETNKSISLLRRATSHQTAYSLVAAFLTKSYYRGIKVVENLGLSVNKGECFGLLGVNGAGKTSTLAMLAADIRQDEGEIFANGFHSSELDSYRAHIGYDPQLFPEFPLTPCQALNLMARLRQVHEPQISGLVVALAQLLDMSEHLHKPAALLSGGTKKKLALAMALIGNPEMVILDEPTAGIDPLARRSIWQLLKSLQTKLNSSVLISSHAMEECETLCNRISIMANGQLRCLGTLLHLRSKFACGCFLKVQLDSQQSGEQTERIVIGGAPGGEIELSGLARAQPRAIDDVLDELQRELAALFGANVVKLTDKSLHGATFSLTDQNIRRSALFRLMRQLRQNGANISYIVNDTSLENIFFTLAEEERKRCLRNSESIQVPPL